MTMAVRAAAIAVTFGAALTALPMAVATIATPAPSRAACDVGQTETDNGCAPACAKDKLLDTRSGRCVSKSSGSIFDQLPAPSEVLPRPEEFAPRVNAPIDVALPDVGLPGVGINVNPDINLPGLGLPGVGLQGVGLPSRKPVCGPGIQTPIPMVGFTPCI